MRQHWRWDKKRMDWVLFEGKRRGSSGPVLVRDIAPYRNVIDGREIDGRAAHRDFLRKNDCVEIGNEPIKPQSAELSYAERKELRQEVGKAYNMVNEGYRPEPGMTEQQFRTIE